MAKPGTAGAFERREQPRNLLYYGDNLDILGSTELAEVRRYVDDESIDLIYLDPAPVSEAEPPFNSNADYNVLFAGGHKRVTLHSDRWKNATKRAGR